MSAELKKWDVVELLDSPERIAGYIEAVLEDGDPALVASAIGDIARARGMAQIAQDTGLSRESLYRALSEKGNPQLATLMSVLKSLGLQLSIKPAQASA
ncbi:addiction module antidote protein [Methylobacterium iners]|uniref:Addiction module antitoxin n=1 Tax=Methylobacterium iners TaxID=418707 RepID=A0ABQ4RXA7_9HYPH|nr:addiction module antidote protein [Methylobacterium iners]GJD94155.1 hypothetical protein OCOJLMKI_1357 [Methylobacterium iners]